MDKDLNAKLVKEPLTKVVKRNGSFVEETVEKPSDSEDEFIDELTRGVTAGGGLTGFGRRMSGKSTPTDPENTGFASFEGSSAEDLDDTIEQAIIASKLSADTIFKQSVLAALEEVYVAYPDLPDDWKFIPQVREAVINKIAKTRGIPVEAVTVIIDKEV